MKSLRNFTALSLLGLALTTGVAFADDVALPITVTVADNLTLAATGMDFGTVAVSGAGSIDLAPDDSVTENGGISQYAGAPVAGNIVVAGTAAAVLDVTLPAVAVTLNAGGADNLTVDTFTSDAVAGQLTLDGSGDGELNVGARLNSAGAVADGTYTAALGSGNPDISFIYN